ncbi:hypothetical protein QU593_10530 [Rossellomorea marisflavi]|uniref:hypothetical protein n=1 Tax=Rossellomorea marisflavi TaxID=189381 RepID=UPI0025B01E08|nr:hypothetical protein [Rossellomorea marisflavi]WJV20842.1 hypothetical protein QU593_10530 [Rossellomorea marisflavi]
MMTINKYTYQEELINEVKKGNSVVGNWARGAGKDFTLARILFELKPKKVLYVDDRYNGGRFLNESIKELMDTDKESRSSVEKVEYSKFHNKLTVEFRTGELIEVMFEFTKTSKWTLDLILFNDYFHDTFSGSGVPYVFMTTKNNSDSELQKQHKCRVIEVDIYDLLGEGYYSKDMARKLPNNKAFYQKWGILSSIPKREKVTVVDFKEEASKKLMNQFLDTPDTKDTVLTRKNIIEMLKDLKQI